MPLRTREARAERLSYEEALKARLARLESHYERLDEGLSRIEAEMAIEGKLVETPDAAAPAPIEPRQERPRRYRPRKPR
jgi:hypothetical protein